MVTTDTVKAEAKTSTRNGHRPGKYYGHYSAILKAWTRIYNKELVNTTRWKSYWMDQLQGSCNQGPATRDAFDDDSMPTLLLRMESTSSLSNVKGPSASTATPCPDEYKYEESERCTIRKFGPEYQQSNRKGVNDPDAMDGGCSRSSSICYSVTSKEVRNRGQCSNQTTRDVCNECGRTVVTGLKYATDKYIPTSFMTRRVCCRYKCLRTYPPTSSDC